MEQVIPCPGITIAISLTTVFCDEYRKEFPLNEMSVIRFTISSTKTSIAILRNIMPLGTMIVAKDPLSSEAGNFRYLENTAFERKVNTAIVESLKNVLGSESVQALEQFLNNHGTSLWNACQDSENVSRLLRDLFNDDGAGLLIETLIKDVIKSFDIKSNRERISRSNLKDALRSMRILLAIMVCAPSVVVVGHQFDSSQLDLKGDSMIVITEYLEDDGNINKLEQSKTIDLVGFWDVKNKPRITVSLEADSDLDYREQILNYSKSILFDDGNIADGKNPSWHKFLSSLSESTQTELYPEITESEDGVSKADIHVILTSKEYSGRNGQAIVAMSDQYIESVEITVFDSDQLYVDGSLAHVIEHEIGHALGLSHSTDLQSIMYPKLVIKDSTVIGSITECEENGLSTLYQDLIVQTVYCD